MKAFQSPLGPKMQAFLKLNRATGKKYRAAEEELRRLDRFWAAMDSPPRRVTADVAHAWLTAKPHLCPASRRSRTSLFRLFCLYLTRSQPKTYVPGRHVFPARVPERRPHIYSREEVRLLLQAALRLSTRRWWFRPQTVYTLLCLLYGTGLRVGEACRLCISDVDFKSRTLHVRDTKFFKSRLVPFSNELGERLQAYWKVRRTLVPADGRAPFFINLLRRPVSPVKFSWLFHRMIRSTGIGNGVRGQEPRLHDLRRTFAVNRILKWYRKGVDIWAKLPLLVTYLGHVNVFSTHVYLTATAELLGEANSRFERRYGALVSSGKGA